MTRAGGLTRQITGGRRDRHGLRQQCRDTLRQSQRVRAGDASGPARGWEALAARMPGANALTLDLTYALLAARGLLTPAEARGAMTPPPAPRAPDAPRQRRATRGDYP